MFQSHWVHVYKNIQNLEGASKKPSTPDGILYGMKAVHFLPATIYNCLMSINNHYNFYIQENAISSKQSKEGIFERRTLNKEH